MSEIHQVQLSNGQLRPAINQIEWVPVATVLPDEARDFTPWLAGHLEHLGPSLGLDDLSLVETEYSVAGFSLDILARSVGPDGLPVWVAIENQYRRTDHSHLGQLITYTAHAAKDQESVLAVWITEEAHPAHLAAVEFLNRTTSAVAGIGYVLLQVRFAPGPADSFHVFFQVLASPNAFLQEGIQSGGNGGANSPRLERRREFMAEIYEIVKPAALAAGASSTWKDQGGWQISLRFPNGTELATWPLEIWIRMSANDVTVALAAFTGHTAEENAAVLDVIYEVAGAEIEKALGIGHTVQWHAGNPSYATDYSMTSWGKGGYIDGDAKEAGDWAAATASIWLRQLLSTPIGGLADRVRKRAEAAVAGLDGAEQPAVDL